MALHLLKKNARMIVHGYGFDHVSTDSGGGSEERIEIPMTDTDLTPWDIVEPLDITYDPTGLTDDQKADISSMWADCMSAHGVPNVVYLDGLTYIRMSALATAAKCLFDKGAFGDEVGTINNYHRTKIHNMRNKWHRGSSEVTTEGEEGGWEHEAFTFENTSDIYVNIVAGIFTSGSQLMEAHPTFFSKEPFTLVEEHYYYERDYMNYWWSRGSTRITAAKYTKDGKNLYYIRHTELPWDTFGPCVYINNVLTVHVGMYWYSIHSSSPYHYWRNSSSGSLTPLIYMDPFSTDRYAYNYKDISNDQLHELLYGNVQVWEGGLAGVVTSDTSKEIDWAATDQEILTQIIARYPNIVRAEKEINGEMWIGLQLAVEG